MNGCNNQTFETYMVSSSNRMAFRAAETAAEHPGEKFTPLCLFGAGGLGKTHLLCAVHERIRKKDADAVICTFTAEEFSGALLKAIQDGKTERLRAQLKQTDALLIDDLQYLLNQKEHDGFCDACFTNVYPTEIPSHPEMRRFDFKISERKGK